MALRTVILAAGQGKRMHSRLPKVLHLLAGKPLLEHVIHTALTLSPPLLPIVVYGHQGEQVRQACTHFSVCWVEQKEQLGTGHALLQALPEVTEEDRELVLYGDVPLIALDTLQRLIVTTPDADMGLINAHLPMPMGYGRVKRDAQGQVQGVVEEKDATVEERAIQEINSGIYLIPAKCLKAWLPQLQNANVQHEYYLPDVIALAKAAQVAIHTVQPLHHEEILGVNDRMQLAELERFYQRRCAEALMCAGVTIRDPQRIDIRGEVYIGKDVTIDVNVILEGNVTIGDDCIIGPATLLRNVTLGQRVEVKAQSVLEDAKVGDDCVIGPFARLRPGTILAAKAHVGNFVEVKNSFVGEQTKINHLSYIGDSKIGKYVNIGAGTITCNYDGANKHQTVIGDDAFIGSNTALVAPVMIGEGATIGAGSTITCDAPSQQLTLARASQKSIKSWQRPQKKKQQQEL